MNIQCVDDLVDHGKISCFTERSHLAKARSTLRVAMLNLRASIGDQCVYEYTAKSGTVPTTAYWGPCKALMKYMITFCAHQIQIPICVRYAGTLGLQPPVAFATHAASPRLEHNKAIQMHHAIAVGMPSLKRVVVA